MYNPLNLLSAQPISLNCTNKRRCYLVGDTSFRNMERSTLYYILYILITVVLYRVTSEIIPLSYYSNYLIFFGAEIPVILVALVTFYYNKRAEYSGIVTITVSIIMIIYAFFELRLGPFILANTYIVSVVHWSVGLMLGVILLNAYRFGSNRISDLR